jgi:hypothetical protein
LQALQRFAHGAEDALVLEGARAGLHGHGLGLQQGLQVRRKAAALRRAGGQGRQFLGGRRLDMAVEAAGDTPAPRGRIVDLFQLRKDVAHRVAHALGRAPADADPIGHLVERQALGGTGQDAGQFKKA